MNWPHCCREVTKLITLERGSVIHKRGDFKRGLTVIASGQVKMGNYGFDGKYHLTAILGEGENFGEFTLFTDLPRTHEAEALTDVGLYQITPSQYQRLEQKYPQIRARMLTDMATKLHLSLEALDDIRRLALPVRLAKFLWQRATESQQAKISIRQSDLAEVLGVTVLAIHKALKVIEKKELIQLGYGTITVTDLEVLKNWLKDHAQLLPI